MSTFEFKITDIQANTVTLKPVASGLCPGCQHLGHCINSTSLSLHRSTKNNRHALSLPVEEFNAFQRPLKPGQHWQLQCSPNPAVLTHAYQYQFPLLALILVLITCGYLGHSLASTFTQSPMIIDISTFTFGLLALLITTAIFKKRASTSAYAKYLAKDFKVTVKQPIQLNE